MIELASQIPQDYFIGRAFTGRVKHLANFGAFISLPDGTVGLAELIHITTDCKNPKLWTTRSPADYLEVGETVNVRVAGISEDRSRLALELVEKRARNKPEGDLA